MVSNTNRGTHTELRGLSLVRPLELIREKLPSSGLKNDTLRVIDMIRIAWSSEKTLEIVLVEVVQYS